MNRLESARIAAWKAKDAASGPAGRAATIGSAVASDAFFPFADGLLAAVEAGATAVIQPGGSIRDEEVIAAADEAGLAMVFTGVRHFRHYSSRRGSAMKARPTSKAAAPAQTRDQRQPWTGASSRRQSRRALRIEASASASASASAAPAAW
jgi:hypothetical protein